MDSQRRPVDRPVAYPAQSTLSSSANSPAYQSSSNIASISSLNPMPSSLSSSHCPASGAAVLPSPSSPQPTEYLSLHQQVTKPQLPHHQYQQNAEAYHNPRMHEYHPHREGAGSTAPETKSLLSQYSLVAEAAKRAQMAVLMRDMEGIEL